MTAADNLRAAEAAAAGRRTDCPECNAAGLIQLGGEYVGGERSPTEEVACIRCAERGDPRLHCFREDGCVRHGEIGEFGSPPSCCCCGYDAEAHSGCDCEGEE